MRITSATWVAAALIAASTAVALWAWLTLPVGGGLPVNYLGFDGVRHHGVSRAALWLMPVISGFVAVSMTAAPGLGAQRWVDRAPELFDVTLIAMAGLTLVAQAALLGRALDADFNVMRPVAIATGVLLLSIGNYLGKARQNRFIGLTTPWALADATVWDKTHRFTGRSMVLSGLALIGLGLALRDTSALAVAIAACSAIPMALGVARSRALYRQAHHG